MKLCVPKNCAIFGPPCRAGGIALSYGANMFRYLEPLNRLSVAHWYECECDRQTGGQTESPIAIVRSNVVRRVLK